MLNNPSSIAISRLDASMDRCGVMFLCSYRFKGKIDEQCLEESVGTALEQVARLNLIMRTDEKYRGEWSQRLQNPCWFTVLNGDDLGESYHNLYRDIFNYRTNHNCGPMFFVLIKSTLTPEEFIIVQCGDHSYCDGGSASMLFNKLIACYNHIKLKDQSQVNAVCHSLSLLESPSPDAIYSLAPGRKKIISVGRWRHMKNLLGLMSYKVFDSGNYATPYAKIATEFSHFQRKKNDPVEVFFSVARLLERCSLQYPVLSPSIIVYALLAKAAFRVNQRAKGVNNNSALSFRVMVDLLNPRVREKYLGNFIAYMPVTLANDAPVAELANEIGQHLLDAKMRKADISMYKMLEFALSSGVANKVNDPTSFTIAQLGNPYLDANPGYLIDAQFQGFTANANAAPKDIKGAQLNNRPVVCFSLLDNKKLFLGFFNTVSDAQIPAQLLQQVDEILQGEDFN